MQPLDGAYQRLTRAGKHLTNLNRKVNIVCQEIVDDVSLERKQRKILLHNGRIVNGVLGSVAFPLNPQIPPIISILIGEVIYNLRAALDYLIYDLAWLESGRVIDGTQFPIEDTVKGFSRRRNTFLKGLRDKHIAAVETMDATGRKTSELSPTQTNTGTSQLFGVQLESLCLKAAQKR